ncbi:3-hydroxyisobutyrate dehydrogenase-like beta-hydroxyacid dehydrogenase [Constrictibacter sp. MBR-5]|jgi:3-hydroxyisobutyrate dehydrogenase-like beta-hydroxyacid dehydrogenase|uniref:NAD(P)-dependent oxidoreductase n=1 Tax=Constrictibacter sp. MBR-5 TaxID=3156467 RepID=UPI0033989DB4
MKVGFIGVGNMGGPMCRNIVKNTNHEVIVFDLGAAAVARCTEAGAKAAGSIAELVAQADVVFTSLPMPKDVDAVALGAGGIGESARPGTVYFDLSTNSPVEARRVAEALQARGVTMLDAPVSGGVVGAEAGTLAVMVGGDPAAYETHLALLRSFAANPIHMGAVGAGSIAKLVNNMMAFCNMAAAAEGLMLGAAAGIDLEKLATVIRTSSGGSAIFQKFGERALAGQFEAAFALDLAYKDLHLALELADQLNVPVPAGAQTHNLMRMARGMGFGRDDSSSVVRVYEAAAGRPLSSRSS